AALGAELSLKTTGTHADPSVESALVRVTAAAGLADLDELAPPQQAMVLALIRMFFAQAADLLAEPDRATGWTFTDPHVLDGYGRGSMVVAMRLAADPARVGGARRVPAAARPGRAGRDGAAHDPRRRLRARSRPRGRAARRRGLRLGAPPRTHRGDAARLRARATAVVARPPEVDLNLAGI